MSDKEFLKPNPNYVVLLISIITAMFIKFTSLKRNQYYTSFWVESIPVLWFVILLFLNTYLVIS